MGTVGVRDALRKFVLEHPRWSSHGARHPRLDTDEPGMTGPIDNGGPLGGGSDTGEFGNYGLDPGFIDPTPDADINLGLHRRNVGVAIEPPTGPTNQPGGDPPFPR